MSLLAAAHKRLAAKFPRIVPAPSRVESVEIQGLVHTMGGARANNTGISLLKKKESKCQTGVFLETVAAPSNLFPLIKHVNVLQHCLEKRPEDAAVPAARGTAADSGVTAQSFGLGAGAEREHGCRQSCGGGALRWFR